MKARLTIKEWIMTACLLILVSQPCSAALGNHFDTSSSTIASSWNSPYPKAKIRGQTLFSAFASPPKHLDPVVSYNSNEWAILSQIYEPPLQYHYLKRPYQLEPLTLKAMPTVFYLDKDLKPVKANSKKIAYSEYMFELKPEVFYKSHPAFVKNGDDYLYHDLEKPKGLENQQNSWHSVKSVYDFEQLATRELVAEDYVYAIKRMALRQNHSPVLDSMTPYIVGLKAFSENQTKAYQDLLKQTSKSSKTLFYDLRSFQINGVKVIDKYRFSIRLNGVYPQFLYWLTMNFFAPIPWEADKFYKQKLLVEKNLTLDTSPVGTGPYYLAENNPNQRMRLLKNPKFHNESYPSDGLAKDANQALLADAGKKLPFIDEVVYSLEKENVPLWNKFLQGYYDASGVSSDSFDQAVIVSNAGNMRLTEVMQQKGIRFLSQVQPTIYYFGFNMADPVVGGYSVKQQQLRQAISIALNFEEYISIFMNGRGIAAQGPVPPGITGYKEGKQGINPYIYEWKDNRQQRRSIEQAKQLLKAAGYENGLNGDGEPLTLYYDTAATGPDSQAQLSWYRKQLAKLGINLVIRATDYNRFQDKVRGAKVQLFSWGWNADYPDPENFLFLLYGANSTINTNGSGINSTNYDNPEFNKLFKRMKNMENSAERAAIIKRMISIAQKDSPWAWGIHPKSLTLYHGWLKNVWPNALANNTIKYRRIDTEQRLQAQQQWNKPVVWPLWLLLALIVISIWPLFKAYQKRQTMVIKPQDNQENY